jgi:hypothetical protein
MPRPLNKIAADVAELLRVDDDQSLAAIEGALGRVQRAYQDGGDVLKAAELRADIAEERSRLQRLQEKWHLRAVQICLHEADQWLAVLANVTGPDPRYHWFDDYCTILARSMILQSRHKRLGYRHRQLAGYLYEAGTGIPDHLLETACRRVTSKKVFEHLPHISTGDSKKRPKAHRRIRSKKTRL